MKSTDILFEFESIMNLSGVFVCGINGEITHRNAYMAIMKFDVMDNILKENKNKYNKKEWNKLKINFEGLGYLSPINYLVAYKIGEFIETIL